MRWIIPAVIVAIAALIVFQVNWLVREAQMMQDEERQEIQEAVYTACRNLEKREAIGLIGNSLDSVFMKQTFQRYDTIEENYIGDSVQHVIVINNSDVRHLSPMSPLPPLPPVPETPALVPLPPMPPLPPDPADTFDGLTVLSPPGEWGRRDSNEVIVIRRSERMKNAVEDVMMRYVFRSDNPAERIDPEMLDSALKVSFREKGIERTYTASLINNRRDRRIFQDTAPNPDSAWTFRAELFPEDPNPFRTEVIVQVDPGNASAVSRILPQIIFSFLITLGMLVLFILIYREAVKQKKIGEIRRDFINNMTHEFKTPLATMSLAADTIMNEKIIGDRDKVKYYAEQIKNENRKLNQQVEKVLELSLTEKKGVVMNKEKVNLVDLIMRAMSSMQIQVEAKGGSFLLEGDFTEMMINADPFHMERVFLNLIDNAMKYGGTPPVIRMVIEHYRSGVTVKISDNGKGIPSSEWEMIFEPFHRVSTGDVHNVKGFGLGLSYAASVVKEHKGSLSVTQSNGSGTTFTLVLMHD